MTVQAHPDFVAAAERARRPVRRLRAAVRERRRIRRELGVLGEPVTFQEKVRYKMLKDRRPLLTTFADKFAVREYVASRVGDELLTHLYAVTDIPRTLATTELPREFVLKPTHASGACVVVADFASVESELPVSPEAFGFGGVLVRPDRVDAERLVALCEHWLSRGYRLHDEWCYRNVPRRILVEELLVVDGGVPFDIKLSVFHGTVRFIQVELDRFTRHARNLYTPQWKQLDVRVRKYPTGADVPRPEALEDMVRIAERLATETDFVRVDLYCVGTRIVFGELTSYPEAGRIDFVPAEFDTTLGAWWTPPKRYRR